MDKQRSSSALWIDKADHTHFHFRATSNLGLSIIILRNSFLILQIISIADHVE